jgi:hypothetical protein
MKHHNLEYGRGRKPRINISVAGGVVLATCIAILVITIVLLAETNLAVLLYRLLIDGGVCAAWLIAAVGWGAIVLRIARYKVSINLLDFVNSAGLGIGLLSLILITLGAIGWLNQIIAWALVVVGIAYLLIALNRSLIDFRAARAWLAESSVASCLWIFAMPALGIALVSAFAPPGLLWGDEPHGYDVVEYHLQVPREWYEAARVSPLQHNVFSYMPMNVELHYLLAMHLKGGPWAGMYVAQLMHLTLIALSVLSVLALARDPTGSAVSTVSAVAMVTAPWLLLLAPIAYNEGGLLFFGSLAIGWAWRALRDPDNANWRCWALAGAFTGCACGVKLTAAPMLLIGIPLASLVARRTNWRSLAIFIVTGTLVFSPWLIRNAIYTRNPVFPEAMSVFGRGPFTEDQQERYRRAHSPPQRQQPIVHRIRAAWDQIAIDWRYGYTLLLAALFAIGLARTREAWFIAALLAIFLIIWIGFTHLQSRFFVLAIPAAAFAVASGLSAKRQLILPAALNFIVVAILGILNLHLNYLERGDRVGRLALLIDSHALGIASLRDLRPNEVDNIPPDVTLALVGDARAFAYDRPISKLRYRTVFDVDQRPGQSIIDAWAGDDLPAGSVLLVDPIELNRMARNYWKIGALPPDVAERTAPFTIQK